MQKSRRRKKKVFKHQEMIFAELLRRCKSSCQKGVGEDEWETNRIEIRQRILQYSRYSFGENAISPHYVVTGARNAFLSYHSQKLFITDNVREIIMNENDERKWTMRRMNSEKQ